MKMGLTSQLLLCGALLLSTTVTVSAQDVSPQLQEAVQVFEQMAKDTHNPYVAQMARENLSQLKQKSGVKVQVAVPLLQTGCDHGTLAVPVLLNKRVMGTFVVDTGASYTVITPRLAAKLGIVVSDDAPRIAIRTANGVVHAPLVTIPSLSLGKVDLGQVQAVVHDLGDDLMLSGLLGLNAFKGMDMSVSQQTLYLGVNNAQEAQGVLAHKASAD